MESQLITLAISTAGVGIVVGILLGYFLRKKLAQAQVNSAEARMEKIISEAKNKEQELLLKAKERAIKVIDDAKNEEEQRRKEMRQIQSRLEQRETLFDQKLIEFEDRKTRLQKKVEEIQEIKTRIDNAHLSAMEKLQTVAGYTKEQAKEELFKVVEENSKEDLMVRLMKVEKVNSETYEEKAREIVMDAIQRCATNHSTETTSSSVALPSE